MTQGLLTVRTFLERSRLNDASEALGPLTQPLKILATGSKSPQLHDAVHLRELRPIDEVKAPTFILKVPSAATVLSPGLVAIEVDDEGTASLTDHPEEDAAVSDAGLGLGIINQALQNKLVGELLSWQQLFLEVLL